MHKTQTVVTIHIRVPLAKGSNVSELIQAIREHLTDKGVLPIAGDAVVKLVKKETHYA